MQKCCVHIFQHQYRRKLSSLLFFPLVISTMQLFSSWGEKKPCRFQTLAKVDGKKPFINVKVASRPTLLRRAEVNSLSTAVQPTRYWGRNTPAGSLWELHCLFWIFLQRFYWNVCPQVSASPPVFSLHLRRSPGLGVTPFILPLSLCTCLTGRVCDRVHLYVSVCV